MLGCCWVLLGSLLDLFHFVGLQIQPKSKQSNRFGLVGSESNKIIQFQHVWFLWDSNPTKTQHDGFVMDCVGFDVGVVGLCWIANPTEIKQIQHVGFVLDPNLTQIQQTSNSNTHQTKKQHEHLTNLNISTFCTSTFPFARRVLKISKLSVALRAFKI